MLSFLLGSCGSNPAGIRGYSFVLLHPFRYGHAPPFFWRRYVSMCSSRGPAARPDRHMLSQNEPAQHACVPPALAGLPVPLFARVVVRPESGEPGLFNEET